MVRPQRFQIAYLVLGLLLASGFSAWRWVSSDAGIAFDGSVTALLVLVGLVVRSASFRMNDWVTISLDTTILVASLFIVGSQAASVVLVAIVGSHLFWGALVRKPDASRETGLLAAAFVLACSLAALLLAAWLLDVDALVRAIQAVRAAPAQVSAGYLLAEMLAWKLGSVVVIFLVTQYALVLPRHVLAGRPAKEMLCRVLLPGLGVELALLPLVYLLVFTYQRALLPNFSGANAGFILVLVTYAGVVVGIRFLARSGEQVRVRLQAMERLNTFHSKISSSLQLNLLSEMVTDTLLDTFLEVDGASMVLQRENVVRVRGRNEESRKRIESDTREYLRRHDESRIGSTLFIPLAPESRGGGTVGFHRDPAARGAFSKADVRLFKLLVNIVDVAVQNARLYEIATIDGLTGLYVRRYFEQRLTEEFIRSGRYGENFTLVLVDLNRFKLINDVHGHIVGDRILMAVGEVLRDSVRSMDVPARYGGDEFAILLPRASREDAELIRDRIEEGIARVAIPVSNDTVGVSAAIGMASYLTDRPADPTEMILKADDRLYEAKKESKGHEPEGMAAATAIDVS